MSVKEVIDRTVEKVKDKLKGREGGSVHERSGSNPHAEFEQSHPFVNKPEPKAFANPAEAGAKMPSEEVKGVPNPRQEPSAIQHGSSKSCAGEVHTRMGSSPHAEFEQSHPFVNKEEPKAFANPCESGAKKPSEDVEGQPMPKGGEWR